MKIAIIPARAGSKRIPKKNIKKFCGRPIISFAIKSAIKSRLFDRIIVSTDSKKIASIAKKYNAEVPFYRPRNLSGDKTGTAEVIAHAIRWLKKNGTNPKAVCCIYATAVLIDSKDIVRAFNKFRSGKWNYVFSATTFPFPIQRAIKRLDNGGITMFQPECYESRSQDLEEGFHDAGQFYFGTPESWINKEKIFHTNSEIFVLPRWRVQDIDTTEDWENAEKLFSSINKY